MAFDLESVVSTKETRPPIVVVYGDHGIGKTTFAASAPSPILIRTEDGAASVDAKAFPICKTLDDVKECISTLLNSEHEYKTVVIDTLDHLERIIHEDIAREKGVQNVGDVPYGAGYNLAADRMVEVLDMLAQLRTRKRMAVIMAAHAEVKRVEDPMSAAYDKTQIKLHKKAAALVRELCEFIGLARLDTVVKEEDAGFGKTRARAVVNAPRKLLFAKSDAYDSKTRNAFPPMIDFNWNAFESAFKASQGES